MREGVPAVGARNRRPGLARGGIGQLEGGAGNRRQLGSYVGLTPSPFQSGRTAREQGNSKAGNPKARTSMIELAWMWLRHQSDSALSRWFLGRVGKLKGRMRRIAVVALARKLLVALWRYLETGLVPSGAILKA